MAYSYGPKRCVDDSRFDSIETRVKINAMKDKYDTVLEYLGGELMTSSELDSNEYKTVMCATGMIKDLIKIEEAKVDALGCIMDQLSGIQERLDDIENELEKG